MEDFPRIAQSNIFITSNIGVWDGRRREKMPVNQDTSSKYLKINNSKVCFRFFPQNTRIYLGFIKPFRAFQQEAQQIDIVSFVSGIGNNFNLMKC